MASLETQVKTVINKLFKKSPKRAFRRNPLRDWQKIMVGSFLMCLAIFIVDGYFFFKINKGELFSGAAPQAEALPTLDRSSLKKLNETYTVREQKLQVLKTTNDIPADPSRDTNEKKPATINASVATSTASSTPEIVD
ncbi:MAG: hypothetical protein V4519_00045 [Patescibacteria group bacterium]